MPLTAPRPEGDHPDPGPTPRALRGRLRAELLDVRRQTLGRELVDREADLLAARLVEEDDGGGVLGVLELRLDAVDGPLALEGDRRTQEVVHAAFEALVGEEGLGAVRGVAGRVDADRDRGRRV